MNNNKSQSVCLLFALTLLVFAVPALQIEWQGLGNMTESNMSQIRTLIAQNPLPSDGTLTLEYDTVATNISTHLNNLWEPAWNVMICNLHSNVDAIVYGYAYKSHWLWFNGLINPGNSSLFMSYIIWKDYNCIQWSGLSSSSMSFFSFSYYEYKALIGLKNSITADQINKDLWNTAYNLVLAV